MNVTQPDILEGHQLVFDARYVLKEIQRFLNCHVQHVSDRFAFECHFQCFAIVPLAFADVAGDVDIGKEMHLDLDDPVTLTRLAPPTFHIEREPTWKVTACF